MIFRPTKISGAFLVDLELLSDERGFFARSWCEKEFTQAGLNGRLVQCSVSFNEKKGTLRGLHYQQAPHSEAKLVRCLRGSIYDVILDLRPDSPTYQRWESFELNAASRTALYIPEGVAHGFQTLEDGTELFYQMSEPFDPNSARTVRWNDPKWSIPWPVPHPILSEKDRQA